MRISETNWNELRYQHREAEFFPEEGKPTPAEAYTWFPVEITINGTPVGRGEVRKKGYIGSNDIRRPGLKVRYRPKVEEQTRSDPKPTSTPTTTPLDLTLNNNRQDPAFIRQYLAYEVFRRADVPAPRCAFVHLKVNGRDLGIYSSVEPINAAFLNSNFGNSHGSLFEGGRSDFRSDWVQNFSLKNDKASNRSNSGAPNGDRSALDRATADVEQTKSSLLPVLDRHFDTEEFFRFWAVESLLNTSDGYAANMNNFYLYNNPATGRFVFIPWGADATLHFGRPMNSRPGDPRSVIGTGILANRLYNSPEGAEKYRNTLRGVLKTAWNEDALLREVNRLEALLSPLLKEQAASFHASVENVRRFIRTRRAQLTAELDGPAPTLQSRPLELAKRRNVGRFTGKFSTTLADGRPVTSARSTNSVTLTGTLWNESLVFHDISMETEIPQEFQANDPYAENRVFIGFIGTTAQGQQYSVYLAIDAESYVAGRPIPINNTHIQGFCGTRERNLGMLRGSLLLTKAPKTQNGELAGEFTADLFTKHPKP